MTLRVEGTLRFRANGKKTEVIEDAYEVRIEAPEDFPERMALSWETGGRIPPDYHKLTNGALCLGSRVGLRLQMASSPSLLRYVERCVIPYLYGYSYSVKHGAPPFGELAHGELGSLQDLAGLLGVDDLSVAFRYCALAAVKRRRANKQLCPCGSGRRLGRCHSRRVNGLRKRVGRTVLSSEMSSIAMALREQSRRKGISSTREQVATTRPSLLEMIREIRRPAAVPSWVWWPDGHFLLQQPA
jgi:hypothetical protein